LWDLVLTTLTKEAFPMIRYRTRDITSLDYSPCACGRTMVRMKKTMGRSDDMLIIKGVNVFPSQIEEVLMKCEGVEPHYQIVVEREGSLDSIEVQVEVSERLFSNADEVKVLQNMERRIVKDIKDYLGVSAKVKLVEPKSLQRFEGKASRVQDRRKI
jgi:phenylacetate-CoA ligase